MDQIKGDISGALLKQCVDKIERFEQDRTEIGSMIREAYSEAKMHGFDPKVIRELVKERKMDPGELSEHEMLLRTYKRALGM